MLLRQMQRLMLTQNKMFHFKFSSWKILPESSFLMEKFKLDKFSDWKRFYLIFWGPAFYPRFGKTSLEYLEMTLYFSMHVYHNPEKKNLAFGVFIIASEFCGWPSFCHAILIDIWFCPSIFIFRKNPKPYIVQEGFLNNWMLTPNVVFSHSPYFMM